jgi:hypothetical protein
LITCYYFYDSAFFSWRDYLDGAILTYLNNTQLCINTFSPRVEEFRKSELTLGISKRLCDPEKLEQQIEGIMTADYGFDRKNSEERSRYLQNKYGLDHLQTIPMQQITRTIAVPGDEI